MASVLGSVALLAAFVRIGGDWDWLVALGDHIRRTGDVPDHVPFAAAGSSGWHDVPVLAQLVASVLHDVGARAAVVAHLVLVAVAFVVLAVGARLRSASDGYVACALALLCVGGIATLGIVRAQTLSLVPFALLLVLLVQQSDKPDRRIWWAVPLVAVWGNLHGAALLGVCVLGAYLLVRRTRTDPWQALAVGVAGVAALCLTPQAWNTPSYYADVFDNVSAQRAEGLWARPSLAMPFDVSMLAAALVLIVLLVRVRRDPWEYVACAGLLIATLSAARHGVWLLMLLVVLAAAPQRVADPPVVGTRTWSARVLAALTAVSALVVAVPVALARGDGVLGAAPADVRSIAATADGAVVLAPGPMAEALAVAGVRLWAGNPLDAFSHADQAAYLDFMDGEPGAQPAIEASDVVVVRTGSAADALVADDPALQAARCGGQWICYVRR